MQTPLWYCISEEGKEKLMKLYKTMTGGIPFSPPTDPDLLDKRPIKLDCVMESGQELERQMKIPTRWRKPPK